MLVDNPGGNYRFLKGSSPYSSGVVAAPGYEIVHVTLSAPLPFQSGFDLIIRHLASLRRPPQALCGVELRSPRPFTFDGFAEFNDGYRARLAGAGILVEDPLHGLDGLNPVARTNVAPAVRPPPEPCLCAFSYTMPWPEGDARPTFVVAGAGELLEGRLDAQAIVRPGEDSADAMREKAAHVMQTMAARLRGLGVGWDWVSAVSVYTVHDIGPFWQDEILAALGSASWHGVRWHCARPPIVGVEYEMDVRGVRTELNLY